MDTSRGAVASCRFRVCGRVQGVGYRYFALRTAMQLGVGGFARNLDDGSVEVLAEGSPESLTRFEEALRRGLPPPGGPVSQ